MPHIDDETLALCALGEDVLDTERRAHLGGCAVCSRAVAELTRVVEGARATEREPELVPPSAQVWSRVHAELGLTDVPAALPPERATAAPYDRSGTAGAREPRAGVVELGPRRGRRAWLPVLVAASTALVLGIVGGVLWERRAEQPAQTAVASAVLEPLPGWPGASGQAVVERTPDGRRQIVVTVDAPVPEGTYREVWLLRPDVSGLVSLGVLEGSQGRFDVPDGLDLSVYPVVDVSEERFDGDPAHSGDSVVRGPLDV